MDEPLSNLDAKLRTSTRRELTDLHRRLGSTFIYVTHDQVEALTMATRIALINGGKVEQIGTPTDVYDHPASVFVAGFLGSPAMNLLDACVAGSHTVTAEAPGLRARLWQGQTPSRDVVFGVRPEHLRVGSTSDEITLSGRVRNVENLGSEEIAYCEVGESVVCVRLPRPSGLAANSEVVLTADVANVHLFDRASGARLEWVPADIAELEADELAAL
jgi:multiple sugar transport system ATP-binding protein